MNLTKAFTSAGAPSPAAKPIRSFICCGLRPQHLNQSIIIIDIIIIIIIIIILKDETKTTGVYNKIKHLIYR